MFLIKYVVPVLAAISAPYTQGQILHDSPQALVPHYQALTPSKLTILIGSLQYAATQTAFSPLEVIVSDASGNPLGGETVTFSGPTTGSGVFFGGNPSATSIVAVTNAAGIAAAIPYANGITGSYFVTATAGSDSVSFLLSNMTLSPTTLNLSAPSSTVFGTPITLVATETGCYLGGRPVFYDGSNPIGVGSLDSATSSWILPATLLAAGTHQIRAHAPAGASCMPAWSNILSVTVTPAAATTFVSRESSTSVTYPRSTVAADLNGDGKLDLVVGSSGQSGLLNILLGVGDGTFQTPISVQAAGNADAIAVADLNGDGHPDLVILSQTSSTSGTLHILLGNGDGTFHTFIVYSIPAAVGPVAVGDFNGDGAVDLALGYGTNSIAILLGYGNGSFRSPYLFATPTGPSSIVVSDFNGDAKADIAIECYDSSLPGGNLVVMLGNGDGTFQTAGTTSNGGSLLSVADLNLDGRPDLILLDGFGSGTVSVMLGAGDGTFQAPVSYQVGIGKGSMATGDFDGDGNPDIAIADTLGGGVVIRYGDGMGHLPRTGYVPEVPAPGSPYFGPVVAGAFNGDGRVDVVAPIPSAIDVFLGANVTLTATAGTPQSAATGSPFQQLQVTAKDDGGQPVVGVPVRFTASGSAATGSISNPRATTNASGIASASVTAGTSPGAYSVTASSGLATSSFSLTNTSIAPSLSISKTHSGNFATSQSGATYTVVVSNAAGAVSTTGLVTVTENIPSGLTLVSMAGSNWNCNNGTATCSRSDALSPGFSYPPITVTVNVAANATPLINTVTVAGGGSTSATASDPTFVTACPAQLGFTFGSFPASGGSGAIAITMPNGCSWTAIASPSWISISSGGTGTGTGTISFTVAANGGAARSGSISVAGQAVTVSQAGAAYLITTIAGGQLTPATATTAASVNIGVPWGVAVDSAGNVYVSSDTLASVFRIDTGGLMTRVAGNGTKSYSGDEGPALALSPVSITGLALDASGNLLIADAGANAIRKVSPSGFMTTVASGILHPNGIAVDRSGNLYAASGDNTVRKIDTKGIMTIVAGTGTAGFSGDNGPATSAELNLPYGVAIDAVGNLYVADSNNCRLRKVSAANGIITTVAGIASCDISTDNVLAVNAALRYPEGIHLDSAGNVYLVDGNRIRRIDANSGMITTVAGSGGWGFSGDGGPAVSATIDQPIDFAIAPNGDLYIADRANYRLRKVSGGIITTVTGAVSGDGGPAPFAAFDNPTSIARDNAGNIYISDGVSFTIRKLSASGSITTFAGTGITGSSGDNGPAVNARISNWRITSDASGNVFMIDTTANSVRKIAAGTGIITTVAAWPQISTPVALAADSAGNLYIAETEAIVKLSPSGSLVTVAGTGVWGYSGDGGPATAAQISTISGMAVDSTGNLYLADSINNRIRMINPAGIITTIAGNGIAGTTGDGGLAANAEVAYPAGLAVDAAGNVAFINNFGLIRQITPAGIISTIAGTGMCCLRNGVSGPALSAGINPEGITADAAGNLYFVDYVGPSVRRLSLVGTQPVLIPSSSHTGTFAPGKTGTYILTVTNAANAGPATGTVTVSEVLPQWLTVASITGSGWTCGATSCSRSDTLNGGSSYPPIAVVVNVAGNAPSQVTNQITVAAGGTVTGSQDFTLVAPPPVFNITKTHTGIFNQGQLNATYTVTVSNQSGAGPTSGMVSVAETMPAGLMLDSMSGSGWDCTSTVGVCSRNDSLNPGASYPAITVTVDVKSSLTTPQTNQVTVSGGGGASVSAYDVTTILLSQTILFTPLYGQPLGTGPFTISASASSGLPVSFSSQTPWVCTVSGNTVTLLAAGTCIIQATQAGNSSYPAAQSVTRSFTVSQGPLTGTALAFVPITPCRILDTRNPNGPFGGPGIPSGGSRSFTIPNGACGVPSTAQAYSLNAAMVPTGSGWLTIYPTGQSLPMVASVNSPDGRVKSNGGIIPAGTGGAITVYASVSSQVVLDINGYFVPAASNPTALAFYPLTPCRVADTRNAAGPLGGPYMTAGSTRGFPIPAANCGVPSAARAFSLNLAVVPLTSTMRWLTAWPAGQAQPAVSSLNDPPGVVLSNGSIVPAPSDNSGQVNLFTTDDTHVVIDIDGYFAPPGSGGLYLYTLTPCRVLDTRYPAGVSPFTGTLSVDVVDSGCGAPSTARDYIFNATAVPPSGAHGYLTMWQQGQTMPLAANLNSSDGAITGNMALVPTSNGLVSAFFSGTTHLVLDLFGYFGQ